MTIDEHAAAVRHDPNGMAKFVAALRADPALKKEAEDRIRHYAELARAKRLGGCWISRTTNETLATALAAANQVPEVPEE